MQGQSYYHRKRASSVQHTSSTEPNSGVKTEFKRSASVPVDMYSKKRDMDRERLQNELTGYIGAGSESLPDKFLEILKILYVKLWEGCAVYDAEDASKEQSHETLTIMEQTWFKHFKETRDGNFDNRVSLVSSTDKILSLYQERKSDIFDKYDKILDSKKLMAFFGR